MNLQLYEDKVRKLMNLKSIYDICINQLLRKVLIKYDSYDAFDYYIYIYDVAKP